MAVLTGHVIKKQLELSLFLHLSSSLLFPDQTTDEVRVMQLEFFLLLVSLKKGSESQNNCHSDFRNSRRFKNAYI